MVCHDSVTTAGSSAGLSIATCHVVLYTGFVNKDEMIHVFILLEFSHSCRATTDVLAILLLRSERFFQHKAKNFYKFMDSIQGALLSKVRTLLSQS